MFRFDDPVYLWLQLLVPVMVLIRFVGWRRRIKKIKKFGDPELVAQLMPDISVYRPSVKFWLALGALSLAIIMLARPQMGTRISHDKRNGIETMIALDISNSMLAEDVAPSRLIILIMIKSDWWFLQANLMFSYLLPAIMYLQKCFCKTFNQVLFRRKEQI